MYGTKGSRVRCLTHGARWSQHTDTQTHTPPRRWRLSRHDKAGCATNINCARLVRALTHRAHVHPQQPNAPPPTTGSSAALAQFRHQSSTRACMHWFPRLRSVRHPRPQHTHTRVRAEASDSASARGASHSENTSSHHARTSARSRKVHSDSAASSRAPSANTRQRGNQRAAHAPLPALRRYQKVAPRHRVPRAGASHVHLGLPRSQQRRTRAHARICARAQRISRTSGSRCPSTRSSGSNSALAARRSARLPLSDSTGAGEMTGSIPLRLCFR